VSSSHGINSSIDESMLGLMRSKTSPIFIIGTVSLVLVTHRFVLAKDLKELIALAKARPGYRSPVFQD